MGCPAIESSGKDSRSSGCEQLGTCVADLVWRSSGSVVVIGGSIFLDWFESDDEWFNARCPHCADPVPQRPRPRGENLCGGVHGGQAKESGSEPFGGSRKRRRQPRGTGVSVITGDRGGVLEQQK
jgi:hypothetical protein